MFNLQRQVSAILSNGAYVLNLSCSDHINNSKAILIFPGRHAMRSFPGDLIVLMQVISLILQFINGISALPLYELIERYILKYVCI